jgi:hypothetical protein
MSSAAKETANELTPVRNPVIDMKAPVRRSTAPARGALEDIVGWGLAKSMNHNKH